MQDLKGGMGLSPPYILGYGDHFTNVKSS